MVDEGEYSSMITPLVFKLSLEVYERIITDDVLIV